MFFSNKLAVELIELGDKTQAQGNQALDNIIGVVEQGNRLADDINLELDKQIEQLDRMEQTVKDTQSILKRANKMIRYFARQIYTDKIIMGLICMDWKYVGHYHCLKNFLH